MRNHVFVSSLGLLALILALLLALVFWGGAVEATGQVPDVGARPAPSVAPEPGRVWVYPAGERKDPVVPPAALYSGEGFPQLEVSMIAFDAANPAASRVLVVMGGAEPIRRVARIGEWVGRYRIEGIERDRVHVRVRTLGALREETLFPEGVSPAPAR